jgi:hypothetical protein
VGQDTASGNRARLAGQGVVIRYNINKVQSTYKRLCIQHDTYKYAMETCGRAYTQRPHTKITVGQDGKAWGRASRVQKKKGGTDGISRALVSDNGCLEGEGGWCVATMNGTLGGMLTLWD